MIRKLCSLLFIGFILHLLMAVWFIVLPTFLPETRFSRIYKTYLLPGPFFRDDRITTSYSLTTSWKRGGEWTKPFNHSRKYFDKYYEDFDPADLYTSRFIRAFDQFFLIEGLSKSKAKQLPELGNVLMKHVPPEADSVHIIVTREYAAKFSVQVDTVLNIRLNAPAKKI